MKNYGSKKYRLRVFLSKNARKITHFIVMTTYFDNSANPACVNEHKNACENKLQFSFSFDSFSLFT